MLEDQRRLKQMLCFSQKRAKPLEGCTWQTHSRRNLTCPAHFTWSGEHGGQVRAGFENINIRFLRERDILGEKLKHDTEVASPTYSLYWSKLLCSFGWSCINVYCSAALSFLSSSFPLTVSAGGHLLGDLVPQSIVSQSRWALGRLSFASATRCCVKNSKPLFLVQGRHDWRWQGHFITQQWLVFNCYLRSSQL